MAPPIPESKIALSYPLYACDFDPQDSNKLIVGGGGGAGRSGVGNKITVLDASHEAIQIVSEVELSRDEDNVTSLAVGQHKGRSTLVYAGINSSAQDQEKGKNEHFRVFGVNSPSKTKVDVRQQITELARTSLFSAKETDAYQRLLRISAPHGDAAQVGAVATGLAKEAQIVLFDVAAGGGVAPKTRGKLDITKEAVDLDIIQTGDDKYQLLYCDNYDIYIMDVAKGSTTGPECVYSMPHDVATGGGRPVFRSIRYLTPTFILAVGNLPKRGGVVLWGYRLPKTGQEPGKARIAASTRLPKSVAQATGLAVVNLSPPTSPGLKQGDSQFVIAVAGHDFSISLYTLEHQVLADIDLIVNLYPLHTFKNAHHGYITGMAFSHWTPPKPTARVQFLKLASVSIGNTVSVHSIPLKKFIDKASPIKRGGPPRQPRYVVALKSKAPTMTALLVTIAVITALIGVLLQGFLEVKGATAPAQGFLAELLAEKKLEKGDNVVLLSEELGAIEDPTKPAPIRVDAHDESTHGAARTWENLPPEQKHLWRERLKAGGHWTADMGETIFKGVLFSELAGVVGQVVGG
ncbi:putative guanine nucleotide exchange factor-like protein [Phaeoacremonium minimum UCRPA7]|uniref:Guanine nucleotide-exchange factor SEC12 n=1 Tax=Phaeoacremonium minimum (strain UCR-PA7) TaxID=1286976 RepID=R8BMN3_PHAM7|nr:putative guanine nucleotide exchange factor-like protein [Phaeoacremonium minimum UCRPA7]EOO00658.1 putative guanine nucleotide exchange factor-like protein [Phaeoacremonium minimum UCRPA7]